MATSTTNRKGLPTEDSAGQAGGLRMRASAVLEALPGDLDGASETMTDAMRAVSSTVSSAPDDTLLVGASIASGMAMGLLLGGAPRILTMGAMVAAVSMGATLAQRHPGRRRAHFVGRPVMA